MLMRGVRVVRGPNWCWGGQDGGEGFVGTVAETGTSESEKTVVVQWDNGSRSVCRVGYLDLYDLRVIDNAQVGVLHKRITCDSCETFKIAGIRYKCLDCYDYDLCYKCYHGGNHDLTHRFARFETDKSMGVNLPPRIDARRALLKGIFIGAKVIRGYDWEWGNQDGGEGKIGTVKSIGDLSSKTRRSTASVKWDKANTEIYRIGHNGLSDIQFIEAAVGGIYYPEHLPILGQTEEQMEFNGIIENIEIQQVMEMENSKKNENSPKTEKMEEQPVETEQRDPTAIHLGPVGSVYALIIKNYVECSLRVIHEERPNLIEEFFRASRNSPDEGVKEMWEILKFMTYSPSHPDCACYDIIETRYEDLFIWESVERGKRILEKRYRDYMMSEVNGDNNESALECVSTYDLVHDFVGLRFQDQYTGLANEMLNNRLLWPMVYFCIRAGGFMAAAECLKKLDQPEYEHVVSLLELHAHTPISPEIESLEEKMKVSYRNTIRNVSDPFKRTVWAVLARVDDISEVARSTEDHLWFRLSLIRADRDKTKYRELQCQILEHREARDASKHPLMYFKLLALTGQFEAAIEFLYTREEFRIEAVHMAIALYEVNLLACPKDTDSPLLSNSEEDPDPACRLNIALLIKNYVRKFEIVRLEEALHYLYLLRRIKSCEEGPNLFEASVADLVMSRKEYRKILGRIGNDGVREQGLLERLDIDCQVFAEDLAQSLIRKEIYDAAIELYDSINDQNGMLWVMCKVLAKVANLESEPGSLRNQIQEKANLLDERFFKEGFCSAHINIVNSFIKLKGLLTFFDLYRERRYPEALKTLTDLRIVPLKLKEVEERIQNFSHFVEDFSKVMPSVLLATMTILKAQFDIISQSTDGPIEQSVRCVWEKANCVTNFGERLSSAIPRDTTSKLFQMEVMMHS